jgi:superfamily II DNA or RNA helicase
MLTLFPHNQTAYEAAEAMLKQTGKAAVIHPTGTGKSMIAFKLCAEHPGERILWLGPSTYIYKTQVENLSVVLNGKIDRNEAKSPSGQSVILSEAKDPSADLLLNDVTFLTYAKLMLLTEPELADLKPNYIILDEFHRAGAAGWGEGVHRLIAMYPTTPILGLSATNIRYLDGQRDMAEELFDGCIASEITLGEAIVRGILKAPKYICSVYSYGKALEKYEQQARHAKSKAVRDKAGDLLEQLRRALEQADGMEELFKKHMTEPRGKYLVFCSDKEHMDDMIRTSREWFSSIDAKTHIYSVYADDPETDRAFADFKEDQTDHLRLLFCIDMLNEGVHVDSIDGVILLRPTISPIVYKQQIGRALSAGSGKEPVIFDIVLNIENLISIDSIEEEMQTAAAYYRRLGRDDEILTEHFTISGKLRNCMELFNRLSDTLTASWDLMYEEAKRYAEANGNLNVPKRYVTETGYNLGHWLDTQRKVRAGSVPGNLSEERIKRLTALGMRWQSAGDANWETYYEALIQYKEQFRDISVPAKYVTDKGLPLGHWLTNIRSCRKSNIRSGYLTEERIKALDELGMVWDVPDYLFERNFAAALEYHKEHGNLNVPVAYVSADGIRLGNWLTNLRSAERRGESGLDERQKNRLTALGMQWGSKYENAWDTAFGEAVRYYGRYGNLDIPTAYVTETGFRLGRWIRRQRDDEKKGKLSETRKNRLNQIDKSWAIGA